MLKAAKVIAGITISSVLLFGTPGYASTPSIYTVKSGDSLWRISSTYGVSISQIMTLNNLTSDMIYPGQTLKLTASAAGTYTVKAGDTLWKIAVANGTTVDKIKEINKLSSDMIYTGQQLVVSSSAQTTPSSGTGISYTVKAGDTLWKIAAAYKTTTQALIQANHLSTDMIYPGQSLIIPSGGAAVPSTPKPVYQWPDVTYIVQSGDTAESISKKFGVPAADILKYNYMTAADWFDEGDKIAISGYAPREYTVFPNESSSPARIGNLVDWFLEGQYIIKRSNVFTLTDVDTGKHFQVKMLGGYNHADVEPLTANDTAVMKQLFSSGWTWTPRAVVIFKDGMNIAASISGMPHSYNSITTNGVTGHFDLYLKNSIPHTSTADPVYVQEHQDMVLKAAGK